MHSNIVYFAYREIDLNTICVYKKIKNLLKRRGGYTVKKEAARCVLTNVDTTWIHCLIVKSAL